MPFLAWCCGRLNGVLVPWGGLPALIVTLGKMYAFRGYHRLVPRQSNLPASAVVPLLGQAKVGPISIPVIILLAVTAVDSLVLNRTRFGRYIYAVGGNEDAARAAGINVKLVKLCVYSICGFLCGLAGLVFTSRLGAAQSISGEGFELIAIASVVVGGASLFGGRGTVGKNSGRRPAHAGRPERSRHARRPSPIQQAILGSIIILAVWLDLFIQNRGDGVKRSLLKEFLSIQQVKAK